MNEWKGPFRTHHWEERDRGGFEAMRSPDFDGVRLWMVVTGREFDPIEEVAMFWVENAAWKPVFELLDGILWIVCPEHLSGARPEGVDDAWVAARPM